MIGVSEESSEAPFVIRRPFLTIYLVLVVLVAILCFYDRPGPNWEGFFSTFAVGFLALPWTVLIGLIPGAAALFGGSVDYLMGWLLILINVLLIWYFGGQRK
jgi:hypothetical protein